MDFGKKIHRWMIGFWEEPFLRAELQRIKVSKKDFGGEEGDNKGDK